MTAQQSTVAVAEVRAWAEIQASDELIESVIDAVDALLSETHDLPDPVPADAKLAVLMQCARLLRRRKTPEGIAVFGTDVAIRVSRFDPDINAMLTRIEPTRLGLG